MEGGWVEQQRWRSKVKLCELLGFRRSVTREKCGRQRREREREEHGLGLEREKVKVLRFEGKRESEK
ncbi:hypothetical protein TIFTF001_039526 [Ficus carica]|uniref:Uncharacterized protein n=1 Tax=Ficus carica TaxID=3494 RepID=A0AA88EAZ5_FICCA|nr:hypothetical protein TIFTF001_039526 [Ficus carica]